MSDSQQSTCQRTNICAFALVLFSLVPMARGQNADDPAVPDELDIAAVVEQLRSADVAKIVQTIESIEKQERLPNEVVVQLTLLLDDARIAKHHEMGSTRVSDLAWYRLIDLPAESASTAESLKNIVQCLPELKSPHAKSWALAAVGRIGKPDPELLKQLQVYCFDDEVQIRVSATSAVDAVGDESATTTRLLGKLLYDREPRVRWKVLEVLQDRPRQAAELIPDIIKFLYDDSTVLIGISNHSYVEYPLRLRAVQVLGNIGRQAQPAVAKLRQLAEESQDGQVRAWAASAVCRIEDVPPENSLRQLGEQLLAEMDHEFIDDDVAVAIAAIGPSAHSLLDELELAREHRSTMVRSGLIDAFLAVDPDNAVERVIPFIADDDELVAEHAIRALSNKRVATSNVIEAYIAALAQHDGVFSQPASSAVEALAELGPAAAAAIPALESLLTQSDITDTFREQIIATLQRIR